MGNRNHDPKTGEFSSGGGSGITGPSAQGATRRMINAAAAPTIHVHHDQTLSLSPTARDATLKYYGITPEQAAHVQDYATAHPDSPAGYIYKRLTGREPQPSAAQLESDRRDVAHMLKRSRRGG